MSFPDEAGAVAPAGLVRARQNRRRAAGRTQSVPSPAAGVPAGVPAGRPVRQSPDRPRRNTERRRPTETRTPSATISGVLKVHPRGFGFVVSDDGDAFVPPPMLRGLLAGDVVSADVVDNGDRRDALAVRVVERPRRVLVGRLATVEVRGGLRRVLAPDPFVASWQPTVDAVDTADGTVVSVALYGDRRARVIAVHGTVTDPAAIRAYALERHLLRGDDRYVAPATVGLEVTGAPAHISGGPARRNLTAMDTITIDGASSRDLDDALSATDAGGGADRVFVHIADVAEAVLAGSDLDAAAAAQATSVYLRGWNRPMLPRELSEDRCSLLPGTERDTLTVSFVVGPDGDVSDVDVFESRIRSDRRLTYVAAEDVLSSGAGDALVLRLGRVARRLAAARAGRPAVVTGSPSSGFDVADVDGAVTEVVSASTPAASALVEAAMVAANEAVGDWLVARGVPAPFRVHIPGELAAQRFAGVAAHFGLVDGPVDADVPVDPAVLADAARRAGSLDADRATAARFALSGVCGRASYQAVPAAHTGLGSVAYVHFTSPIRRYADLVVHRAVKAVLHGTGPVDVGWVDAVSVACNRSTQRADWAERDAVTMMWLALLPSGSPVSGVVVGFNRDGARVLLDRSGVLVSLPLAQLPAGVVDPDGFALRDAAGCVLVGAGARVSGQLAASDVVRGTATMTLAARPARRRRRRR